MRNHIPHLRVFLVPFHKSTREKRYILMTLCKQKPLLEFQTLQSNCLPSRILWVVQPQSSNCYEKCQLRALRLWRESLLWKHTSASSIHCWDFGTEVRQKQLPYKLPLKDNFWSVTGLQMKLFLLWKDIKLFWGMTYPQVMSYIKTTFQYERETHTEALKMMY